jgi:MFS transporter, putative metabolite:H+ symporter
MYLIGGGLALIGVLLRFQLPESARWLTVGRLQQAAAVIDMMEHRASARISLAPVERPVVAPVYSFGAGFTTILVSLHYPRRHERSTHGPRHHGEPAWAGGGRHGHLRSIERPS